MRESEVERWLGAHLSGCLFFKFVSPGARGVPDRIVVSPSGRVYFVELKREGGVLSALQRTQLERIRAHGCDARVVVGIDGARAFAAEVVGRG